MLSAKFTPESVAGSRRDADKPSSLMNVSAAAAHRHSRPRGNLQLFIHLLKQQDSKRTARAADVKPGPGVRLI